MFLPQKLQICKLGDIRAIRRPYDFFTKNDELRRESLQEYNSSFPWIEHEIITLLQKLDWKIVRGVYILVQEEEKHFFYNGRCTICLDSNASETKEITDTKKSRKVNHQIHGRPEQNAKD